MGRGLRSEGASFAASADTLSGVMAEGLVPAGGHAYFSVAFPFERLFSAFPVQVVTGPVRLRPTERVSHQPLRVLKLTHSTVVRGSLAWHPNAVPTA